MGGRIVDFGGWALPVQYTGIIEEHNAVRQTAGIFDVSHMGEIEISGPEAMAVLQKLLTNDVSKIGEQEIIYSPMCYPNGGVVDDLLAYCLTKERYILVVNGSNIEKDFAWIKENSQEFKNVKINDLSDKIGLVAIQGPNAQKIMDRVYEGNISEMKYFTFEEEKVNGKPCLVSRTGYTGEDGYEIYTSAKAIVEVFNDLMEAGKEYDLQPCGLGSRDTLRFEVALPLYGNELGPEINPLEARLKIFVDLNKEFIGSEALNEYNNREDKRQLVGLEMIGKGIPRHGYPIEIEGQAIGQVTSGSFSPTLNKNLGLGLIKKEYAKIGNTLDIMIRNRAVQAEIVKLPFYKRGGK